MGAKNWVLIGCDAESSARTLLARPPLDRPASAALAARLFPSEKLTPLPDASLAETNARDDEVVVGCFPGLRIVSAREFAPDRPSHLPNQFLRAMPGTTVRLHAMHSVVDWFAFAEWDGGRLRRSLSVSPEGIIEDLGTKLAFELPYWAGEHPAVDPGEDDGSYPLPFHPLEFGEAALQAFLGYQLEGPVDPAGFLPEDVPLLRFKRAKPWWKLW